MSLVGYSVAQSPDYQLNDAFGYSSYPETDPDPDPDPEYEDKIQTVMDAFLNVCAEIYRDEMSDDGQSFDEKRALIKSGFVRSGDEYIRRDQDPEISNYTIHAYMNRDELDLPKTYRPTKSQLQKILDAPNKDGFVCAFKLSDKRPGKDEGSWWLSSSFVSSASWLELGQRYRDRLIERGAPLVLQSGKFVIVDEKRCQKTTCFEGDSLVLGLVMPRDVIDFIKSKDPSPDLEIYKVTKDGKVQDLLGNEIAQRKPSGLLVDALGTHLGHLAETGDIFDKNGALVARAILQTPSDYND